MKIAVLGAGALGSLYGAWCAEAGHEVVLVGRPAHVEAVSRRGLTVRSGAGETRCVALDASTSSEVARSADVVLVASKGQDTATVLDGHRPAPGLPLAAWSVQNGIGQARPLVARYGAAAIGCSSMVGASLDEPGVVTHTFAGTTYLGPLPTSDRGAVDAVVGSLGPAVTVEVRPDIGDVLWSKAVLATAAMGLSVLLRLPYHHVFVEPGARRTFYAVIAEAASVAEATGASLVDLPGPLQAGRLIAGSRDEALERLAEVGRQMVAAGHTSTRVSMLQSLESGRRLEVGPVFGDLLAVADEHGLAVPLLRVVADLAETLDRVNARQEGP